MREEDFRATEEMETVGGETLDADPLRAGLQRDLALLARRRQSLEVLMAAVRDLSLARSLPEVVAIVRRAARKLNGADGATFVLRDGDDCFYADEDAIGPLWKGRRFPLDSCISGWSMLNKAPAVIEDIYRDPRIPAEAYRPTFVRSLVMVPIRKESPIGSIGNYWARRHAASPEEVDLIQALADAASLALENVQVYSELDSRVRKRTSDLEAVNHELDAFAGSVCHDLRSPLSVIMMNADHLAEKGESPLTADDRKVVAEMQEAAGRMRSLIEDLLRLSRISRSGLEPQVVDLGAMAEEILARLAAASPDRDYRFVVEDGLETLGDPGLLRVALENLLSNAWKYSSGRGQSVLEVGRVHTPDGFAFYVRDNGVGFDMAEADRLFRPFERLASSREYQGIGVGLATAFRVIEKHGGRIWAEAAPDRGATFYFRLRGASARG